MKRVIIGVSVLLLALLISCKGPSTNDPDFITTIPINLRTQYSNIFITASGTHYYDFSANGNIPHSVLLTNLGSDMSWTLFTNPSYSNPGVIYFNNNDLSGNGDEIGSTPSLTDGVTYYLAIEELGDVPGTYNLYIVDDD